jgi:general stress protein CsbA
MTIQIGMPCGPETLCTAIGWILAIITISLTIGLLRVIYKEIKKRSK